MKYNQPAGKPDGTSYVDGNRSAGIVGDIPTAKAIEDAQRELVHLIAYSGQSPSPTDLEQVRKAVGIMIAAATGGGDPSQYVTMAQARGRIRAYPEVATADGRMGITVPGVGQVRIPAGVTVWHRSIFSYTTAQTDLATAASKTYHLRQNLLDGSFALKDLANGAYNPGALAEANATFDSTYDDMLAAKVVTDALNVVTVINLANKVKGELVASFAKTTKESQATGSWAGLPLLSGAINFARTPRCSIVLADGEVSTGADAVTLMSATATRYALSAWALGYGDIGGAPKYQSGAMTVDVVA